MRILDQILEFISKNKKNIFYVLLFIVYFFASSDFAFATDPKPEEKKDVIIQGLNGFLSIVASLLGMLTMFIGLFLRPEWTSGSVIGLDTQLKTMWILISNIVYFVFAGIFVVIAFMNIIGHGDSYELKKAIPKFIVGVLIVPFSWFFVQFILSISSVLTVGVLSLPYDTLTSLNLKEKTIKTCDSAGATMELSKSGSLKSFRCVNEKKPISIGEFIKQNDHGGLYSIMTIYTYGVMRLDETGLLYGKELKGGIENMWGLTVKTFFDLIFLVVYTLLLVALFLAFMTRGIALWFYVMFSPVFGLLHYFGKGKDGMGDGAAKKFNLHEFISLAFVPVYVAGALSFGVVFLHVAGKGFQNSGVKTGQNSVIKLEKDSATIGNTKFTFPAGKTIDPNDDTTLFGGFTGPIGALMIQMLGLAVMWISVMAALKTSDITKGVTSDIAQFGNQIGSLIAKAPSYAPILPGGLSAQGLSQVGQSANTYFSQKSTDTGKKFMERHGLFSNDQVNADYSAKRLADKVAHSVELEELKELKGVLGNYKDVQNMARSDELKNLLKTIAEKTGAIKKDELDKLNLSDPQVLAKVVADINNKNNLERGALFGTQISDGDALQKLQSLSKGASSSQSSTSQTSQSTLPSTITKTQNGDNVTVNITKLDGLGKATSDKVDVNINKGKLSGDDFSKLSDALKTHKGEYNIHEFKSMLKNLGITDQGQIDKLVKEYLG